MSALHLFHVFQLEFSIVTMIMTFNDSDNDTNNLVINKYTYNIYIIYIIYMYISY